MLRCCQAYRFGELIFHATYEKLLKLENAPFVDCGRRRLFEAVRLGSTKVPDALLDTLPT